MASNIDKMAQESIARNDASASALEGFQAEMQGVFTTAVSANSSVATDVQTIKTVEAMASADAQAKSAGVAVALGTNRDAAGYALDQIAAQYSAATTKQNEYLARMSHATDLSNITDDTWNWLKNAALYDVHREGAVNANAQANLAKEHYLSLNNMTQQAAVTQNAIRQSVTTETAKLLGNVAKAEVDAKTYSLQIDSLRTASEATVKIAGLKNDNMNIALRARDQALQEQQMAIARQNSALQQQSLSLALEERQDRRDLKAEEVESRVHMLNMVNKGREINGNLPPFRSFNELQTAVKMDKTLGESVSLQYRAGLESDWTGTAALAASPYEALKYVGQTGAQITDSRAKLLQYIDGVRGSVVSNPANAAALKKESDFAKVLDESVRNQAVRMASNITLGGDKNIYAPPPLTTLANDPTLATTYLGTKILKPLEELGGKDVDFNYVVDSLMKGVSNKEISLSQADSELGFLGEKIVGYNNAQFRYSNTAGIPNMKSANVALKAPPRGNDLASRGVPLSTLDKWSLNVLTNSNPETVDLINPAKRSAYLNRRMASTINPVLRQQAAAQTKIGVTR